jgi:hypothetical protein
VTAGWTHDELQRVGAATELRLAPRSHDGTLRQPTTIWVVRVGDDLYVRSAGGPDRPWYRHALSARSGRIEADGVGADVTFEDAADAAPHQAIDAAYHAKYDRFGPGPVSHVTGPTNHPFTIHLVRRDP